MRKINKININGEVYDIQDNSSGYVKGTEINDLVNQLVDEKVAEYLKAGFNAETVDKLPTENISYKTIYLVPTQKEENENIYDEYIYTSKDEWEMIGSTKTDLSNYYTKEEIENKLKEFNNILKICEIEAFSKSSTTTTSDTIALNSDFLSEFATKINELLKENKNGYILFNGKLNYKASAFIVFVNLKYIKTSSETEFRAQTLCDSYKNLIGFLEIAIRYDYNEETNQIENVISTSGMSGIDWLLVMTTTSKHEFTPTNNYHVANKKYVDDSISNALGEVNAILATLTTVEESEASE